MPRCRKGEDAHGLFDGMPPRKKKKSKRAPPVIDVDRIGALPDSILHHLLSFLPAEAAVQTCVLARRWRHLWRSTTGLRIDSDEHSDFEHLRKFIEHLLIMRERTDLDTVEIRTVESISESDDVRYYVNLWIRFAVICKVRVLSICNSHFDLYLDDLPLVSRQLRTLHLKGVVLRETFLESASCPTLQDLKMTDCDIEAVKVSSRYLKHLSIIDCCFDLDCRLRVSTPGLVSLNLVRFDGRAPFLENMALIESAYVELDKVCEDIYLNYGSGVFCGDNNNACENCVPIEDDYSSDCVLLGSISSAKHLKLLCESRNPVFVRDLKYCPTFCKLKTLLLNEYWCNAPDLDPLACILKNSPVLENLTLQLFSTGPNHQVKMKGSYSSMEGPFAISEHLKMVEVNCNVVNERIAKVLKFLTAFNIRFGFE